MLRTILPLPHILGFRGLLTLFSLSSFGQTFLISIPALLLIDEGLMPLGAVLLIHAVGKRASWLIQSAVNLCVLRPAMRSLAASKCSFAASRAAA